MSDTQTKTTFSQQVKQQTRDMLLGTIRTVMVKPSAAELTLGEIIADSEGEASLKDALMSLTLGELRTWFTTPGDKVRKAREATEDVPVADWEANKAAHKAKVLAFLAEKQLGEGDHARGFTPVALRTALTGSEVQMREILKELVTEGKVVSTGETKGKKFVVAALKAKAEAAQVAEKAAADKAKAEKEARKASGETTKGKKGSKAAA